MNYLSCTLDEAKRKIVKDFESVLVGQKVIFNTGEIAEIASVFKIVEDDSKYECVAEIHVNSEVHLYYMSKALSKGTFTIDNVADFNRIYTNAIPVARQEVRERHKRMQEQFDRIQAERAAREEEERRLAAEERKRKRETASHKQYYGEEDD